MVIRFAIPLVALFAAAWAGVPAWAANHLDFQRQQCNSDAAELDAQIAACIRIVESGRFRDNAKSVAYYNIGVAYHLDGQLERAIESFDKAIELDPDNVDAVFNRDLAAQAVNDPGKKIEGEPRGRQEITRRDLPEDMRRNTSIEPVERTKQVREKQTDRTVKKRTKATRTKMERTKVR